MFLKQRKFLSSGIQLGIRGYRLLLSPFLRPSCRFLPSCSEYAEEAYKIHGVYRGTILTVSRLLRCNFLSKQKIDPVPSKDYET